MPTLRRLSGERLVSILSGFGFTVHSQRGSHIKLRRITQAGTAQAITIPLHRELDRGTLHAIFRQAARFIPEEELLKEFFTAEDRRGMASLTKKLNLKEKT